MTQEALGEHCGVARKTILEWEKGTSSPGNGAKLGRVLAFIVQHGYPRQYRELLRDAASPWRSAKVTVEGNE